MQMVSPASVEPHLPIAKVGTTLGTTVLGRKTYLSPGMRMNCDCRFNVAFRPVVARRIRTTAATVLEIGDALCGADDLILAHIAQDLKVPTVLSGADTRYSMLHVLIGI